MRRSTWLLLLLPCGTGCAHAPGARPALDRDHPVVYTLDLRAEVEGRPPVDIHGRLSLWPAGRNRDGSEWHWLRFDAFRAPAPLPIEGLSLRLRSFRDGELLVVEGLERLGSAATQGGTLAFLAWVARPQVPRLAEGEAELADPRWLVPAGPDAGWRPHLAVRWVGLAEGPAWRGAYGGSWEASGRTAGGGMSWEGEIQGELTLDPATGDLLEHAFSWSREVRGGDGGALQRQRFSGRVVRAGPPGAGDAPPAGRLDLPEVASELARAVHWPEGCPRPGHADLPIVFRVERSGALRPETADAPGPLEACAARAVAGVALPPHAEPEPRLRTVLLLRDGALRVLPVVERLDPLPPPGLPLLPTDGGSAASGW